MGSGIARHARAQVRVWRAGRGLGVDEGHLNGRGRDRGGWAGMGWAGTCGSRREVTTAIELGSFVKSLQACRAAHTRDIVINP